METQKTIADWAEQTFGPVSDPEVLVKRADTELQELLEAVQSGDISEIGKETADVIILLMRLLEQSGLDFGDELNRKMQENRARSWISKGDGTGTHIKA
jgi:NTP pyrophosphatase (non-canonical NTP hydrolase)